MVNGTEQVQRGTNALAQLTWQIGNGGVMSSAATKRTARFYDDYWPRNIPDSKKTREHILSLIPNRRFERALDAGCGTGVCSLALAEVAEQVVSVDLSADSVRTAHALAQGAGLDNTRASQSSVLTLPFASESFDLVLSWGVIHHTSDPVKALDEFVRILRPGGVVILAVYLETSLTFAHEAIRAFCLRSPRLIQPAIINGIAAIVKVGEALGFRNNVRDDNKRISSQVEDWFFVPIKHFVTVDEMERRFRDRDLSFELLSTQTGRYRSSSNFIVRGTVR